MVVVARHEVAVVSLLHLALLLIPMSASSSLRAEESIDMHTFQPYSRPLRSLYRVVQIRLKTEEAYKSFVSAPGTPLLYIGLTEGAVYVTGGTRFMNLLPIVTKNQKKRPAFGHGLFF